MRIPLEDDAIVTERGVEWFYPVKQRILPNLKFLAEKTKIRC